MRYLYVNLLTLRHNGYNGLQFNPKTKHDLNVREASLFQVNHLGDREKTKG
jgi:hypothetical protein